MKKINQIQRHYALMFFIFLVSFAQAKSFEEVVNNILDLISNVYMKSIGALIVVGIGIYMFKEKERLKEISVSCIIIILAIMAITNAREIINFIL
ncbi:TrbC/VirB2 family protein [Helicobacter sp. 13S00482-2]|uniref:TrbC/VirB2 family protein n=1 Tax=Helicobacter sp. 13S00482-2 TaxID=1476200 RepID=UPI000BA5BE9E|nr:TrbC/VirB2 family protein [Helicobacter sp. 13S00482-2]